MCAMLEFCDRATHVYGKEKRVAMRPPTPLDPVMAHDNCNFTRAARRQHIATSLTRNSITCTWQASVNTALLAQGVGDARGGGSRTAHGWSMARIAWCLPSIAQCVGSSTQCACTGAACVCVLPSHLVPSSVARRSRTSTGARPAPVNAGSEAKRQRECTWLATVVGRVVSSE
jgi:hypothetical protein